MTRDDVLKIAELAKLHIEEAEIEEIKGRFEKILAHFNELSALDTSKTEALFHFQSSMPLAPDTSEDALQVKDLEDNAPDFIDDCFRIPKVLGEKS